MTGMLDGVLVSVSDALDANRKPRQAIVITLSCSVVPMWMQGKLQANLR